MVAGAAVAALGALILGEYEFTGAMPFVAGVLFGLVVAEVVVSVGRWTGVLPAVAAAVPTAVGLAWAAWIDSGEGLEPWPVLAWAAIALGVVAAGLRAGRSGTGGARVRSPRP